MGGAAAKDEAYVARDWPSDDAVEDLYRREGPRLVRLLSRRTGSPDEAQDLVQDVFFRLTRMGGRLPASLERPQAYLARIAANLLKDRARVAQRQPARLHLVPGEYELAAHDPLGVLEARDRLRRIEAALLKLRPRTREIFIAHRVRGETSTEIAARLGLTVSGVEKQMAKALAQLDRILHRP